MTIRLSKLQRTIIALAHDQERITPADVKAAYYGFPFRRKGQFAFSVPEIGFSKYRAAGVSVSRALATLRKKGLVERVWHGVRLTGEGQKLLRKFFK